MPSTPEDLWSGSDGDQPPEWGPGPEALREYSLGWLRHVLSTDPPRLGAVRRLVLDRIQSDCPPLELSDVLGALAYSLAGGVMNLQLPMGRVRSTDVARSSWTAFQLLVMSSSDVCLEAGWCYPGPIRLVAGGQVHCFASRYQQWVVCELNPVLDAALEHSIEALSPRGTHIFADWQIARENFHIKKDWDSMHRACMWADSECDGQHSGSGASSTASGSGSSVWGEGVIPTLKQAFLVSQGLGASVLQRKPDGAFTLGKRQLRDEVQKLFGLKRQRRRRKRPGENPMDVPSGGQPASELPLEAAWDPSQLDRMASARHVQDSLEVHPGAIDELRGLRDVIDRHPALARLLDSEVIEGMGASGAKLLVEIPILDGLLRAQRSDVVRAALLFEYGRWVSGSRSTTQCRDET